MRPETDLCVGSKDSSEKRLQGALEIAQSDAPSHIQSLQLIEGAEVGGVDFVASEGAARRNDANGRCLAFHGAHLDG